MTKRVELRCPNCGKFLAEVTDFARVPCPECGSEVTFRSKAARAAERERAVSGPVETRG